MSDRSGQFSWADGVSLKEYMDSRFTAQEQATRVAYAAMESRLEGMNEFRASMSDMTSRTVTRPEFDLLRDRMNGFASCVELDAMKDDIRGLRESRAELAGKASQQSVNVALLFSVLGLLMGVISLAEKLIK